MYKPQRWPRLALSTKCAGACAPHADLIPLLQAILSSGRVVHVIVGVDTVVESAGAILEKPNNADHALSMLQSLSGGRHFVHTGVAFKFMNGSGHSFCETTSIEFAAVPIEVGHSPTSPLICCLQAHRPVQALQAYVATGEVCTLLAFYIALQSLTSSSSSSS